MVEFHKPDEPQQPEGRQSAPQDQQPQQAPQSPQTPPPYGAGPAQQPTPPPHGGGYGQAPGSQPYGQGPGYGPGPGPGGPSGPYAQGPGGYAQGPGQYPQGGGWGPGGQPGYAQPMRPPTTSAMWAHLGALLTITVGSSFCCGLGGVLGWIAPMTIRNNEQNRHDPLVRHHGTQAMNFGITQAIVVAVGAVLYFTALLVGISLEHASGGRAPLAAPLTIMIVALLVVAFEITSIVFAIIATVKANRGEFWSYPKAVAWPMVKP
ncbi:DUF4870 domain-containing protein [Streptomyces sp. NRRL F-5755]|uniref:DUF4870 domain-containing protein n=1 Tax=Streptomyces sp. NRRL F-5755 TaxID=1519475 RepID=UPI00099B8711|nr:DUF4870 domain-containing protein [Streptomyces sp. NRRL F-5755]